MAFMEWVRSVAAQHDDLQGAIVSPDGEWLDILLPDGRTFRFRPSQLLDPNAPETERTERLNRLISIGVKNAQAPAHTTEETVHNAATPSPNPSAPSENVTPDTHNLNPADMQEKSLPPR